MAKPKLMDVDGVADAAGVEALFGLDDCVQAGGVQLGASLLGREPFDGASMSSDTVQPAREAATAQPTLEAATAFQNTRLLDSMPDAVAVIDRDRKILWSNARLREWAPGLNVEGMKFPDVLGEQASTPAGVRACDGAFEKNQQCTSTVRWTSTCPSGKSENRFLQIHAIPIRAGDGSHVEHLIVLGRDVTTENLQQQKLVAIHKAGVALAEMTAEELALMSVEDRKELLKQNILHYTHDLLQYNVIEVRLLDRDTGKLVPLLAFGMEPSAMARELFSCETGNGVTGWVAATGKSYLCHDTASDPLYLEGFKGAKSSLTVPLVMQDQVIGTFNVESPAPDSFGESDLQFLEIFARDVAAALHTLDLLQAERMSTTVKSVEAIHSAVALPIDDILIDAVMLMEAYQGHEPEILDRLRRILRKARDIKQVIQGVGRTMSPTRALPVACDQQTYDRLRGRQVLVVDADEEVRSSAHKLLEQCGCVVETAHDAGEAIHLARSNNYGAIIADSHLPDMSGYAFFMRLREMLDNVPMVLMREFGYDADHTIVKARAAGVRTFLFKPFGLENLVKALETVTPIPGVRGSA